MELSTPLLDSPQKLWLHHQHPSQICYHNGCSQHHPTRQWNQNGKYLSAYDIDENIILQYIYSMCRVYIGKLIYNKSFILSYSPYLFMSIPSDVPSSAQHVHQCCLQPVLHPRRADHLQVRFIYIERQIDKYMDRYVAINIACQVVTNTAVFCGQFLVKCQQFNIHLRVDLKIFAVISCD